MRAAFKYLVVALVVVATGGMTLSAQPRGADRLPRVLDPLGILPPPRHVLRSLGHTVRVWPRVVVEDRHHAVHDYDEDWGAYPVQRSCGPLPGHGYYRGVEPFPIHRWGWRHRYGHRRFHDAPGQTLGSDHRGYRENR